jgi:hypothetical protein
METAEIQLFWLPLGAGGRSVRWNGRVFEALAARHEHRPAQDLDHSALAVRLGDERYVIEMAPAWSRAADDRGVVRTGAVGLRWLGLCVLFRYEVRLWRDGVIPDVEEAVGGPTCIDTDPARTRRLLEAVSDVPAATWGRDELGLGEMWNSNSLTAWSHLVVMPSVTCFHRSVGARPGGTRGCGWPGHAGWRIAASSSMPSTSRVPGRAQAALASTAWTGTPGGSTPDATSVSARDCAPARS